MLKDARSKQFGCFRPGALLLMLASTFLVFACIGCPNQVGNGSDDDDEEGPGETLYSTAQLTTGGQLLSCAQCHGPDGSGGRDPEIRGSSSSHLQSHAQDLGTHPDGVKYPDLTHEDFEAIATFLGGVHSDDEDGAFEGLVGDANRGQSLFTTPQPTSEGVDLSCASCHRQDGAGAAGPSVREQSAGHLLEHAQGGGPHPEGIKYTGFSPQDFVDMAAFLAAPHDEHD